MCCCASPNVNGTIGYQWSPTDRPSVRAVNPPTLAEHDTLVYDLPGRCGGQDSHCHHYRIVNHTFPTLLVRHGGGDDRVRLSNGRQVSALLATLDDTARYWLCNAIYRAHADGRTSGRNTEYERWYMAAAQKRIKVRKDRGRDAFRVSITG